MFTNLLHHLETAYPFSSETMFWLRNACNYWNSLSPEIENKLLLLKEKYSYENLVKIRRDDSRATQLEFWKAIGEFALTPAIDEHDIDREFMLFVSDFQEHLPAVDFELAEIETNDYYDVIDRLFYTWISFLWQKIKGKECGIPVCTVENNSVKKFYFNDFLFDDYSSYQDSLDKRIEGSIFIRDLSIEEIYMRTSRNYRKDSQSFSLEFEKGTEKLKVLLVGNKTTVIMSANSRNSVLEEINHLPNKTYDNSRDIAIKYLIEKSNELLNSYWRLMLTKA